MKKIFLVLFLATMLLSVVLARGFGSFEGETAEAAAAAAVNELLATYEIPPSVGGGEIPDPLNLAVEAAGRVWFTMPDLALLGSLVVTDTTDFTFTTYQTTPGGQPYDLAYDAAEGLIWFTEKGANNLGKLEISTGTITTYTLPATISADTAPTGIDISPGGFIWYVGENGNLFGRFNPTTETFTEWEYPTSGAQFIDVAASSDTEIWGSSPALKRMVVLRANLSSFFIAPVNIINGPLLTPQGIDMGLPNAPWVSVPDENLVGFLSPGTLTNWKWFVLPGSAADAPSALVYDPVGSKQAVWYVKSGGDKAGRLIDSSASPFVAEIGLPAGSAPAGVAVDENGSVWITAPGTGDILEWRPPYFLRSYLPLLRS